MGYEWGWWVEGAVRNKGGCKGIKGGVEIRVKVVITDN